MLISFPLCSGKDGEKKEEKEKDKKKKIAVKIRIKVIDYLFFIKNIQYPL
jgi:hypothetical protein